MTTKATAAKSTVLRAIWEHWQTHGSGPSVAELQQACGFLYPKSVHDALERLEQKGLIERDRMKSRQLWPAGLRDAIRGLAGRMMHEQERAA